jgi:hypothetical protein
MEEWDSWLAVETEREIQKQTAERENLTTRPTGKKLGCLSALLWIFGVIFVVKMILELFSLFL